MDADSEQRERKKSCLAEGRMGYATLTIWCKGLGSRCIYGGAYADLEGKVLVRTGTFTGIKEDVYVEAGRGTDRPPMRICVKEQLVTSKLCPFKTKPSNVKHFPLLFILHTQPKAPTTNFPFPLRRISQHLFSFAQSPKVPASPHSPTQRALSSWLIQDRRCQI